MAGREKRGYFRTGRIERDVLGCAHCTRSILLAPPKGCDRKRLVTEIKCSVWERWMEAHERRSLMLARVLGG